ncbi:NUDIX hydrolase [Pandoraea pulmonicola]|uniref:Coenzyme A pyrophosphatase n=1 Tax=Pandoraea pulmonicola TaxID=93221 RepID=A0AAJ4ZGE1_PANPU|nr:CoA pyrophosphatase [Pandoraea pulmonicola]APD13558.1 coenzyme A pyrophosphatase [Pandoraea pulmonicola]SUA92853.1 putative NUDIX hydrolase [Pandoraea pulmonicola]
METERSVLDAGGEPARLLTSAGTRQPIVEAIIRGVERCRIPGSMDWSAARASLDSDDAPWKLSAVLIALVAQQEPTVLLTTRSSGLREYASQVSFPGGRPMDEDHDVGTTALREAFEEICLQPDAVRIVGCLPIHKTRKRNHAIVPVVGLVSATAAWEAAPAEVEEVFEFPLATLHKPELAKQYVDGERTGSWYWAEQKYDIWGVTAVILKSLSGLVHGLDISENLSRK